MTLIKLYEKRLEEYKKTGVRERPDKLLAMLLLADKDKYKQFGEIDFISFYKDNRYDINSKITKVINDFKFSKQDLLTYADGTKPYDFKKAMEYHVLTKNQWEKVWGAFYDGIECTAWGIANRIWETPENIYAEYFVDVTMRNQISDSKSGGLKKK